MALGQRFGDQLRARAGAELVHGVADVGPDRVVRDPELLGDLGSRGAERHQLDDFALAWAQDARRLRASRGCAGSASPTGRRSARQRGRDDHRSRSPRWPPIARRRCCRPARAIVPRRRRARPRAHSPTPSCESRGPPTTSSQTGRPITFSRLRPRSVTSAPLTSTIARRSSVSSIALRDRWKALLNSRDHPSLLIADTMGPTPPPTPPSVIARTG